jgi:uncharacterized protein YbjT (DUF2867 family)
VANLDLVTGAFSQSGARIAETLLARGRAIRTLTFHTDRQHRLRGDVDVEPYRFDDPAALARSLEGVTTLYNTYWVRFNHGGTSFDQAVANSRALFTAALRAGVTRIVHISIANPALDSPLAYYRGKAQVERALAEVGIPHSIVRPTWIFGGDHEILANNIAWVLRRMPFFAVPGSGRYPVQPVHIDDLAAICIGSADAAADVTLDAAGPETLTFEELIRAMRSAVGARTPIVHVPPRVMSIASRGLGAIVRDVVLTPEEIRGLMDGLLVSHEPPLGQVSFSAWLEHSGDAIGRAYASELDRHYRSKAA